MSITPAPTAQFLIAASSSRLCAVWARPGWIWRAITCHRQQFVRVPELRAEAIRCRSGKGVASPAPTCGHDRYRAPARESIEGARRCDSGGAPGADGRGPSRSCPSGPGYRRYRSDGRVIERRAWRRPGGYRAARHTARFGSAPYFLNNRSKASRASLALRGGGVFMVGAGRDPLPAW